MYWHVCSENLGFEHLFVEFNMDYKIFIGYNLLKTAA
jgi:hypothetical protein